MRKKSIEFVVKPTQWHWVGDGFKVFNIIPTIPGASIRQMDPFISLDYNALMRVAPNNQPAGVDVHPHRGFETVSIVYKGKIEHRDNNGQGGIIGAGDVQWMTAASGILHQEIHERNWSKHGGDFQMVQLWINLPAKDKMRAPAYQSLPNLSLGIFELPDEGGKVEVIAGEYRRVQGPARTFSPVSLMNAKLHMGGYAEFRFPATHNTSLLVIEGSVAIEGKEITKDHFVKMAHDGEEFGIMGLSDPATVLIMSGEPLREPIVAHGPFVMNTEEEIFQAIEDFSHATFEV